MYIKEKEIIKNALGDETYHLLRECRAILAGGAVTSIFTNKEINDWDIYFKGKAGFSHFIREIYGVNELASLSMRDCRIASYTDRSILTKVNGEEDVQLIVYKFFPTGVGGIFEAFDFTINMGAYDFFKEEFVFHPNFFKHNAQRYLSFNHKTDYPLVSALRVQKYTERGYSISKAEMLKILFACAKKDFKDWDTVKDEVGSMYGLNPDEVFDDTIEFSLDAVIQQLEKNFPVKRFLSPISTDLIDVYKKFTEKFDDSTRVLFETHRREHGSLYWGITQAYDPFIFRLD